jgi:hypothetical protein
MALLFHEAKRALSTGISFAMTTWAKNARRRVHRSAGDLVTGGFTQVIAVLLLCSLPLSAQTIERAEQLRQAHDYHNAKVTVTLFDHSCVEQAPLFHGGDGDRISFQFSVNGNILTRAGKDLILVGDLIDLSIRSYEDRRRPSLDAFLYTLDIGLHVLNAGALLIHDYAVEILCHKADGRSHRH